jgi:predicted DNA-binding transcriptional regulator AlpA
MKADRGLTVRRMVELAGVSRASFYRFDEAGSRRGDLSQLPCATPHPLRLLRGRFSGVAVKGLAQ